MMKFKDSYFESCSIMINESLIGSKLKELFKLHFLVDLATRSAVISEEIIEEEFHDSSESF